MKKIAFFVILFLNSLILLAEGTKEVRPNESDTCNFLLLPQYSNFGLYNASVAEQIRLRIATVGETIYYGFNNKNASSRLPQYGNDDGPFAPNVPFKITSPSGIIVYSSFMPDLGVQGNIADWKQAVNGPKQLGNPAGYDALSLVANEVGDYVFSFDPTGISTRLELSLFDVTVTDTAKVVQTGRLHCQGWQLTMTQFETPFHAKIYPYDGGSAVYEVDMNGLAPLVFIVNFNSKGTANTGNQIEDRKSKIGQYLYREFEVFLNPPDSVIYPAVAKTILFSSTINRKDCITTDYCFNITVNGQGQLDLFIDLNRNGIYDPKNGEIAFSDTVSKAGTRCIPWNGKDAFGNIVINDFEVVAKFGFGNIHLPLYDAEDNWNGLKVKQVRPIKGQVPLLFWDDSYITAGSTLGDPLINLQGCSSVTDGCHKWADRGSKYDAIISDQETINTWWYSTVTEKVLFFDNPLKNSVKLSFDANRLHKTDTVVCVGDNIPIYIHNDGNEHYNNTRYNYEWFLNGTLLSGDIRKQLITFSGISVVKVRAIDKTGVLCDSYDSLFIRTVNPVRIKSIVTDPKCNFNTANILVQIVDGPSNPVFHWLLFPANQTGFIGNLANGTYALHIKDENFSDGCAFDTTFQIKEANGITIDRIVTVAPNCYDVVSSATGSATVFMTKIGNYQYAWDTVHFVNNATNTGLLAGTYYVKVKDVNTGCTALGPYSLSNKYFTFPLTLKDEICNDTTGEIKLFPPVSGFTVRWNNVNSTDIVKNHLDKGVYNIHFESSLFPACVFDTNVVLKDLVIPITIQQLLKTPSDCGVPTGTAIVMMPNDGRNYQYDWDGKGLQSSNKITDLSVGNHHVHVQIAGSECLTDADYFIPGNGFDFSLLKKDNYCRTNQGKAIVTVQDPSVTIKWNDSPSTSLIRTGLGTGRYVFQLKNANDPLCVADSFVNISAIDYSLFADFNYQFTTNQYEVYRNVSFTNLSDPQYATKWDFSDGGISREFNTEHLFYMVSNQVITLTETDSNGCTGRISKEISLSELGKCGLTLPNAFSPNNDNINNTFGLLGKAYSVDFKLFNRWGEVIFRTKDVSDRWDGIYRGIESPLGVYPYTLEYECPYEGKLKVFNKVGEITLIR